MKFSRELQLPVFPEKETEKNKNIRNAYLGIPETGILYHHGLQFVPNLKESVLTELFRGRPVISADISKQEQDILSSLCPTNAFENNPFCLNLGKCVFCKECHFAMPEKIRFTNDYKIASNDPEMLKIYPGQDKPIEFNDAIRRKEVKKLFRKALKLRQVSAAGDNSCELELNASGNVNFDMGRYGIEFVASPRHADGIVITGPISENMAEALQTTWDAVPSPKVCILAGVDAISGGIFANSPALNRSFLSKYKIDLYVPGNPCHPLTFINGVLSLIGK
jgi:Ni,Fe-hydrogenase III small subunit